MNTQRALSASFVLACLAASDVALAQSAPAPAQAPAPAAPAASPPAVVGGVPVIFGAGPVGATDQNSHLGASSRPVTDINGSGGGFDLNTSSGPAVVRGGANGAAVLGSPTPSAPSVHVVRRGDTLAEISERYFSTMYLWPKIWAFNPEIQNPNWIYPGDQVRLRAPQAIAVDAQQGSVTLGQGMVLNRGRTVAPNTIFLRDQGWIDDIEKDTIGELAASFDDHMFLSPGDDVYVQVEGDREVKVGSELTFFRPLRNVSEGDVHGQLVAIIGAMRVQKWDPDNKVARGPIIEADDAIERGAKAGIVARRYDVVPVVRNQVEVVASVLTSPYPHVILGSNQVLFVDKGSADGLVPGNRLFVVRKGDTYRNTLTGASRFATTDVRYERNRAEFVGGYTGTGLQPDAYPEEVVGEVRVLSTREHASTCLLTNATLEIEPGDTLVARKGY